MTVSALTVGVLEENAYLVIDAETGDAVLVDPGAEPERLVSVVEESGAALRAIWLTHGHLDHIGGVAGVKRRWDVPVYLHAADRPVYALADRAAAAYGIPFEQPAPPDAEIREGDTLRVGHATYTAWHVPGHAPGHMIFIAAGHVLGGDLLFAGSIGRVDLPFCNPADMQRSLDRLSSLPDATVVYPGHGPFTTLAAERASNPFLAGGARVLVR